MATDRGKQVFVLPHSHLDLFWLGNRHECLSRGCHIIARAMRLCLRWPGFRFLIEDAVFLQAFVEAYPELQPELSRLVSEGRIELPAKWAGITITNVNGETIARNTLYGLRAVERIAGSRPDSIHLGDLPAITAQFAQVMHDSGVRHAVMSRGGPGRTPLFRWQAPDGSGMLVWHAPFSYFWGVGLGDEPEVFRAERRAKLAEEVETVAADSPSHVLMHYGWDLTVPNEHAIENVEEWNQTQTRPMRFATQREFFEAVRDAEGIPVLTGDMPTVWGNWPDAAYLDVTVHHGPAESEILWAERMAALDLLEGYDQKVDFKRIWKPLLESLDHNYSLIATEETHASKNSLTSLARQQASDVVLRRMQRVASEIERPEGSIPLVVFNPSSFARTELVRQRAIFYGPDLANTPERWLGCHLVDDGGAAVPFQIPSRRDCGANEADIEFLARDIPPMGYRAYYLVPGAPEESEASLVAHREGGRLVLRNGRLTLECDAVEGSMRVLDSEGRALVGELRVQAVEQRSTNQVMQLDSTGRTFPLDGVQVELPAGGPAYARVVVKGTIDGVPVSITATLPADGERIDLSVAIDWSADRFLRFQLYLKPAGGRADDSVVGVPFGANPFANVIPGCGPTLPDEVTSETWSTLREAQDWLLVKPLASERALAVATERKLIEFLPEGVAINMLSGMTAKWITSEQVFHPFAGRYETRFALRPVEPGDIDSAARLGEELFMPLKAFCSYNSSPVRTRQSSGAGLSLEGAGVRLTCLKPAEDGRGVIARLLECGGEGAVASLHVSGAADHVTRCNVLEEDPRPTDPSSIELRRFGLGSVRLLPRSLD